MFKSNFPKEKCNSCMFKEEIVNSSLINCSKANSIVVSNPLKIDNFTYPFAFSIHDIYSCSGYRENISFDNLSKEEILTIINEEHQILLQLLNKQSVAALELFSKINNIKLFEKVENVFYQSDINLIPREDLIELAEIYIRL